MVKEYGVVCDRCHKERHKPAVASCQHPAVNRVYGKDICMDCCRQCKHHEQLTIAEHGLSGIRCRYKGEQNENC